MPRLLLALILSLPLAARADETPAAEDQPAAEGDDKAPPAEEGKGGGQVLKVPPQPKGGEEVEGVLVETGRSLYVVGDSVDINVHNKRRTPIFVPGCDTWQVEVFSGDMWAPVRGETCSSEGDALAIEVGDRTLEWTAPSRLAGEQVRVALVFGWGCDEGRALSQAACEEFATAYSARFSVKR